MGDFNSMFPNFLAQCLSLKTLLTPIAFLLITGGLIASTIAHDSHNIIVVGADDDSMLKAAHTVADMRGGMAAVQGRT